MTLLDVFTTFFYRLVVTLIKNRVNASTFIAIFTFFATPSILIQNALSSVLPRFSISTYHPRLTQNLRLCRLYTLRHCCRRTHSSTSSAPQSTKSIRSSSRCHRCESRHWFSAHSKREVMMSLPNFVSPPPQLYYFDCYNTLDKILFFDTIQAMPDIFSACYNLFDPQTGDYYNLYFDSSLFDVYYDAKTGIDRYPGVPSTSSTEARRERYQSGLGLIHYPPSSIDTYLSSFNVLNHYRTILNVSSYTNKQRLLPDSPIYKQILLNARGLQAQLRSYGEVIPLHDPIIYHSSTDNELPIVIDTGASCSITPSALDFDADPVLPDFNHLTGISSKTSVNGQGIVTWLIEDKKGVWRPISTKAYLVTNTGIQLFSPQTYIQENRDFPFNPHLPVDRKGAKLSLACGTCLSFPLQTSSNLHIMLTEGMLSSIKSTNLLSLEVLLFNLRETLPLFHDIYLFALASFLS